MPLNLFYTMVQKSQKWPKTQIKGGPALRHVEQTWRGGFGFWFFPLSYGSQTHRISSPWEAQAT